MDAVTEPERAGDERTVLLGFLQRQRDLVAWKLRGAADDVLRSAATPSGLTAHGLVRHLTNVERSWVREVVAGERGLGYDWTDDDPDAEFRVPADVGVGELLAEYAAESARCDAVIASRALDDVAVGRDVTVRWVLLHLVEETARHLGHLDLLREQADGVTGGDPGD